MAFTKNYKVVVYIMVLLALPLSLKASSLDQLINSYDYDYSSDIINITNYDDYMLDLDSDGTNDTLYINLTTNVTSGDYIIVVSIRENGYNLVNISNVSLGPYASFVFKTYYLTQSNFNYSVKIYNSSRDLVFKKYLINSTNSYPSYESGLAVTSVSDESINGEYLRVNITLNATETILTNLTCVLTYGNNSIAAITQTSMSPGLNNLSFIFNNESIKSTHYNGNFTLSYVSFEGHKLAVNQSLSYYSYETFSKTSYIHNFTSNLIYAENSTLADYLLLNFSVNVKNSSTYTVLGELRDLYDNVVLNFNKSELLDVGENILFVQLNGSQLYKRKLDGPYVISYVSLSENNYTLDKWINPHTTAYYRFFNFSRPKFADLYVSLNNEVYGNNINFTLNVSNLGKVPAFNVYVDFLDNESFVFNASIPLLNANDSKVFNFSLENASPNTFIALVDLLGLVEEENESNNIAGYPVVTTNYGLNISGLKQLLEGNTSIFEFIITNNESESLDDVIWSLDTGEEIINGTINISLTSNESTFVYAQYQYTANQSYTVTANASAEDASDSQSIQINSGALQLLSLEEIYSLGYDKLFEFKIHNNGSTTINGINWSFDAGDSSSTLYADELISLNSSETAFIYVQYTYSSSDPVSITATATSGAQTDSKNLPVNFTVSDIDVTDFKIIYRGPKQRIFEFIINNTLANPLSNIIWTLDTGVENITSSSGVTLNGSESIFVEVEYNYSDIGDYTATATATNATTQDSETVNVKIKEIAVSDLRDLMKSTNQRLFEFIVTNNLDTNMTNANWNISFGDSTTTESTAPLTLEPNEQVFIYVQTNYSAGSYTVNATAWNSTTTDSDTLDVII